MPPASERRRAALVGLLAAAGTVLVLLVAVWAATAGPDDPFRGDGPSPDLEYTEPTQSASSQPPEEAPPPDEDRESSSWLTTAVVVVLALVALALLGTVVPLLASLMSGRLRWGRGRRVPLADAVEPVADPVTDVVAAVSADAGVQEQLLGEGSPRNGIVACWHRFEVQAERAGVAREPWETSAEFTLRLLDLVEADPTSVARLAALYREARFSAHELVETDREAARDALRRIRSGLRTLPSRGAR